MIIFKYQYVLCKKSCGKPSSGFTVNPSNFTDFTKVFIDQRSKIKCFKRVEAKDIKDIFIQFVQYIYSDAGSIEHT